MLFLCRLHTSEELKQIWASMFKQRATLLDWEVKEIERNGWENQLLKWNPKLPLEKQLLSQMSKERCECQKDVGKS